eukprot:gb/GEZN01004588.1/.p1 GENE.gb/GEZN01004588.1/~~gb/GEZN01004588.1/.p1  ORF type:complete len:422 (-),score=47.51 gb/GEZN01004588.1/:108-1373(-)
MDKHSISLDSLTVGMQKVNRVLEFTSEADAISFKELVLPFSKPIQDAWRKPVSTIGLKEATSAETLKTIEKQQSMGIQAKEDQTANVTRAFNKNVEKGIKLLKEKLGVESNDAKGIANFFKVGVENYGLSKRQVGQFLGRNDPINLQVLQAYADQCSFQGMSFVSALRSFLEGFRLPGEAQQIDRIMQKFAHTYTRDNPGTETFKSPDAAYVLAFALIMLNTDMYNTAIARKMTFEQFSRNTRRVNDGGDFDKTFLRGIYDEIQGLEIQMRDGHHGEELRYLAAKKEGWLNCKTEKGVLTRSKRNWFLLMDNTLYCFLLPARVKENDPKAFYLLEDARVIASTKDERAFCLQTMSGAPLKCCERTKEGPVMGQHPFLWLQAEDKEARDSWMAALHSCFAKDSFYHLMTRQKTRNHLTEQML